MKRLSCIRHPVACMLVVSAATVAHGQNYPAKSVRLIVPYAPGGIVDYAGRLVAQRLGNSLNRNFVVDNRPGAGGVIGIETASKASGDGYTLLIMDPAIVINPSLLAQVPYDINKDLVAVTILTSSPLVLAINAKVPANSVQDLVNLARSQPGTLSFASAGVGTTPHMAGEMFKARIEQNIVHVPYKGSGPAMTDLISGQVQMTFSSITAALPFIRDGRLRGLATTGSKRAAALSNLPTIAEAGFPGFEVNLWLAVFVPADTPGNIVARLNTELQKALQLPEVKSSLEKVGVEPLGNSPQEAAAYVKSEFGKWAKVIRDGGLRAD
jgi:tripartite-type tricarboxylate transporter receptor subunit TctC